MVLFNYATRELTAKIVYYGPGLCGKTTNLQYIHENLPGQVKGKMLSLATKTDRTLFFDFLPIDLGEIRGMKTRVQLYTVPGQVFYNETRKLVLKGADGIVFVADSQEAMIGANVESFKNLEENLRAHNMNLAEMPHVIQFNKRDLPKVAGIEEVNAAVNKYNAPFYEAVATTGIGVQDTLKAITKLVLLHLTKKYDPEAVAPAEAAPQAPGLELPTPPPVPAVPQIDVPGGADPSPPAMAAADEAAEVDDLMAEIADAPALPIGDRTLSIEDPGAAPASLGFELDTGAGGGSTAGLQAVSTPAPPVQAPLEPAASDDDEVLLKDVASDAQLFQDPDLDVATMAAGEERELVIPVRLDSGNGLKPFKLSIRLRLEPADDR